MDDEQQWLGAAGRATTPKPAPSVGSGGLCALGYELTPGVFGRRRRARVQLRGVVAAVLDRAGLP